MNRLIIKECDFNDHAQCQVVISLMNHYMADKMGGHLPVYTSEKAHALIEGLRKHPSKLVLLARFNEEYVGLANCFINFSTFAAKPSLNIHDIVVLQKYRDQGIGRRLMEEIVRKANKIDCCKITLEVREDNASAQALYASCGFKEYSCNALLDKIYLTN
jgi:ribosomal protein S18 acetylase RimI-like enzyme